MRLAQLLEDLRNEPNFVGRNNQHHADAEVEGTAEIVSRDISEPLQELEDWLFRPGVGVDLDRAAFREHTRDVICQSAAGDMSRTFEKFRSV